jgi:arylsulfatase A-like enzyme
MVTNVQAGNTKPGEAERERVAELYAGEIRYVDHELARLVAKLRERGLYERALVAFASDHGEEFWEHGRYEHGHTLYDEVLRVPLFLKLPGETPVQELAADVSTEALVPTVLDVLGLAHDPEDFTARSLAPLWRAPGTAPAEPLFAGGTYYFGEKRAVVFDGLKLVLELDTKRSELYDLARDPLELDALSADELEESGKALLLEREERCRALRARLGIREEAGSASPELLQMMGQLGYGGE